MYGSREPIYISHVPLGFAGYNSSTRLTQRPGPAENDLLHVTLLVLSNSQEPSNVSAETSLGHWDQQLGAKGPGKFTSIPRRQAEQNQKVAKSESP